MHTSKPLIFNLAALAVLIVSARKRIPEADLALSLGFGILACAAVLAVARLLAAAPLPPAG